MDEAGQPLSFSPTPRLMVVMFTDLVGSTALKEELGVERYRVLKGRHDQFVRQALAIAPSGVVIQDTGDGYFLSFASVAQAVSAALLFQWLMAHEPWPCPFASRVGLHLGEVEEGRSEVTGRADFISSAIDAASRTMSLGVGGQVLMTRSVADSARQVLRNHPRVTADAIPPPLLVWKSHGDYVFKGCVEAVEIFEVGVEGVAPLAPPPDSEKAKRVRVGVVDTAASGLDGAARGGRRRGVSRRRVVGAAIGAAALVGGGWWWYRRPDPLVRMRRLQIERDVSLLKAQPLNALLAAPADAVEVDRVEMRDNAAFDVLTDGRVLDMRGWKEVPQENLGQRRSQIAMKRRIQLRKNAPAQFFDCQARTSGLDVVLSCSDPFPTKYEIQRGESFVGQDRMKVRKLAVDVSSVPVGQEFELHVVNTYWNSMQTEAEQWFGLIGYQQSFDASMLLIFPSDRPFKSYALNVAKTEKDTPRKYDGTRIVLEGAANDWIYWEVPNPESGNVYRLNWTW